MKSANFLRYLFLIFFPVVIIAIFLLIFNDGSTEFARIKQQKSDEVWLNRAAFFSSEAKAEMDVKGHVKSALRRIEKELDQVQAGELQQEYSLLSQALQKNLAPEVRENCQIWAFSLQQNDFVGISCPGIESQNRRIMEKAIDCLHWLAENPEQSETQKGKSKQKSLLQIFGENCSPPHLAAFREGLFTPVDFAGQPRYLAWRCLYNRRQQLTGALLLLSSVATIEDQELPLQILADRSIRQSRGKILSAFYRRGLGLQNPQIIFPGQLKRFPAEKERLSRKLTDFFEQDKPLMRCIQDADGYRFYCDHLNFNSSYYLCIISRSDRHLSQLDAEKSGNFTFLPALFALGLLTWYFCAVKPGSISLEFSFKALFFATGIIPLLITAYLLLLQVYQFEKTQIVAEINRATGILDSINQESETISIGAEHAFKEFMSQPETQDLFLMPDEKAGNLPLLSLEKKMNSRGIKVDFVALNRPNQSPRILFKNPEDRELAESQGGLYSISAEILCKFFPGIRILLSRDQESMKQALKASSSFYDEDIFLDSLESVTAFQSGGTRKFLYLSTILAKEGRPELFITAAINFSQTIIDYLNNQFNSFNTDPNQFFLAVDRFSSQSYATVPKIPDRLKLSRNLTRLMQFGHSSANSSFPLAIVEKDMIFLYDPFYKIAGHYGLALIDTREIRQRTILRALLIIFSLAAFAVSIYVLSSVISSLMISPLKGLKNTFQELADGRLETGFVYKWKNELGLLAAATAKMIGGLRERALLGKFVSNTMNAETMADKPGNSAELLSGTVLFSDIRNFTTMAEACSPDKIARDLNFHLKCMVEIIADHGGTVEQFIGDAIVAFFPGEASIEPALRSAKAMMRQRAAMNRQAREDDRLEFKIGIGIACGELISGVLSTANRSEFTLIGEPRTGAEELEALSKTAQVSGIMLSESVNAYCSKNSIPVLAASSWAYELDWAVNSDEK